MPAIYTDEALNAPYRLQCNVLGVPGHPNGFLTATRMNNSTLRLDLMPPASPTPYTAELYVETFDGAGNPLPPGPKTIINLTVYASTALSAYTFLTSQLPGQPALPLPTIRTADPMPARYKLRAKVIDGSGSGYHAATTWQNQDLRLDQLGLAPGHYPVALYWLKYDDNGGIIQQIGPENTRAIFFSQSQVALSSYWFHQSSRASITTPITLPPPYRLAAQLLYGSGSIYDAATVMDNNGTLLNQIPASGTYTVRLFWQKFNVTGTTVIESGPVSESTVTITDGPLPLLAATGHINANDNYDGNEEFTGTDMSVDIYDFTVPASGRLRIVPTGITRLGGWLDGPGGSSLGSFDGAAMELNAGVGVYRLWVSANSEGMNADQWGASGMGDYGLQAILSPLDAPPTITSAVTLATQPVLGTPFTYTITASTAATEFAADGLPFGLALNKTTGVISGTPWSRGGNNGTFDVSLYATNGAGTGPTKTLRLEVAKATPVVTFANRTFVNEPRMHAITAAMLNATVAGLPNLPPPMALPITYRVSQGTNLTPTGSNPLGKYLSPYSHPLIKIIATYPGDVIYAETTVEATFRDVIEFTPTPPAEVRAVLRSSGGFSLAWLAPGGVPPGITTGFEYEVSLDGGQTVASTVPYGQLSTVVVGRAAATPYQISVRARDDFGNQSLWSAPQTVTTLAAGEAPVAVARWLAFDNEGLRDEVFDAAHPGASSALNAGNPVIEHTVVETDTQSVTYTEWVQHWAHIPGYSYTTGSYLDDYVRRYYVPAHWEHEWTEETQEITVPVLRPEFRSTPRDGYIYKVGRLITRPDGTYGLNEVYTINPDDTVDGINRWLPVGFWGEPAYYTIPFVLVRKSLAPGGCVLNLPGMGTTATANAATGTITLGNGTKITAGANGATVTIPSVGTVTIGTNGNVSVAGGGAPPAGVTHTPGVPSLGLPGGITVNPGTGEVTIAGPAGSAITVGGQGGLRVALPPSLASIAGVIGKAVDALGKIFGDGTDPTKTKVDNGDGTWRDLDDPALGAITGTQTVRVGATRADGQPPTEANIISILVVVLPESRILRAPDVHDPQYQLISGNVSKALPGQYIDLKLDIPEGYAVTDIQWTVSGKIFKDYTATKASGALVEMAVSDFSKNTLRFYWADSGPKNIRVKFKVNGFWQERVGAIDVIAPTATLSAQIGVARINSATPPSGVGLIGTAGNPEHGIAFNGSVSYPSDILGFGFGGWNWVQLATVSRTRIKADDSRYKCVSNGVKMLDTVYPYDPIPAGGAILNFYPVDGGAGAVAGFTHDSPAATFNYTQEDQDLQFKKIAITNEEFVMYIMFFPPGIKSKYVPLKFVAWRWGIVATRTGSDWSVDAGSVKNAVDTPADTSVHPVWSSFVDASSYVVDVGP